MKYSTKLTALLLSCMCLISGVALSATWQKVNTSVCKTQGDICTDGTIYMGMGMYITPVDAPYTYAYASSAIAHPYSTSEVDGKINTYGACQGTSSPSYVESPVTSGCSTSALPAMAYCYNLTAFGHTDWYLPSVSEMGNILNNTWGGTTTTTRDYYYLSATYNVGGSGAYSFTYPNYWSSTSISTFAYNAYRGMGYFSANAKTNSYRIRCARRDTNPL